MLTDVLEERRRIDEDFVGPAKQSLMPEAAKQFPLKCGGKQPSGDQILQSEEYKTMSGIYETYNTAPLKKLEALHYD